MKKLIFGGGYSRGGIKKVIEYWNMPNPGITMWQKLSYKYISNLF
jgi:hypothetical protein